MLPLDQEAWASCQLGITGHVVATLSGIEIAAEAGAADELEVAAVEVAGELDIVAGAGAGEPQVGFGTASPLKGFM